MNSQQTDSGSEGARQEHNIFYLYCSLLCWRENAEAILIEAHVLCNFLGITVLKDSRKKWFENDAAGYFNFIDEYRKDERHFFILSKPPKDQLDKSKIINLTLDKIDIINQLELESLLGDEGKDRISYDLLSDKLPFLNPKTRASSHLVKIKLAALATGTVSILDI